MSLATRSASGQSVRLHGKVTHTSPAIVRSSGEAVEKATGKRPIGWSGPDFQETPNTPNLLAAEGRRTINEVNLLWREWFDGLYADGAITGRLMVLHLHPWIMGQRDLTTPLIIPTD